MQKDFNESQTKIFSLEENKKALESQKKDLLSQIDHLVNDRSNKEELISNLQKTIDEKDKSYRNQITQQQNLSKQKIGELTHQIENQRAELVHKNSEIDTLRMNLEKVTAERTQFQVIIRQPSYCSFIF